MPGKIQKILFCGFMVSVAGGLALWITGTRGESGPFVIAALASLALFSMGHFRLKSFSFTIWVFTFVAASMFYPAAFRVWFGTDLKILIVPLIQVITFGMGTTLSGKDFARIFVMPWPVIVGFVLQFSIMPLVGFTIASLLGFEPEVAAGVILIGSVSGGVASNLITYLAGGNVALSVTMTACSTLMSPLMTPFLMKTLAGKLVPVNFVAMMLSILDMIIVPIAAGLIANKILYTRKKWAEKPIFLAGITLISLGLSLITLFWGSRFLGPLTVLGRGLIIGFALIGVVVLAKLIIGILLKGPADWMDKALPVVSMSGICFIIAIITAQSRNELLAVGPLLIAAAVLHNSAGYLLGYWGARLARLSERDCRTVAIEVGMQNGGMASGIAIDVLKSTSAALAPAIFGPWMNISGSVLASFWRRSAGKTGT